MRLGTTTARPNWLLAGLGLAIVLATYLFLILVGARGLVADQQGNVPALTSSSTALIALAGYLLGAALIIGGVARQFTTSTYALIPLAIAINIVIGQIVSLVKIPLYLDSIGTVLVGVLVGPLAGAATGGLPMCSGACSIQWRCPSRWWRSPSVCWPGCGRGSGCSGAGTWRRWPG